jgi:hypothetical protein
MEAPDAPASGTHQKTTPQRANVVVRAAPPANTRVSFIPLFLPPFLVVVGVNAPIRDSSFFFHPLVLLAQARLAHKR